MGFRGSDWRGSCGGREPCNRRSRFTSLAIGRSQRVRHRRALDRLLAALPSLTAKNGLHPAPPVPQPLGAGSSEEELHASGCRSFQVDDVAGVIRPLVDPIAIGVLVRSIVGGASRDLTEANCRLVTRTWMSSLWGGWKIPSKARLAGRRPQARGVSGRRWPTRARTSANPTPRPNAPANPASSEIVPASASAMQTPPRPAPMPTPR